jgi:PPOX class probable FMN-dependent enzyme
MLTDWLESMRAALDREFAERPRIATLATVAHDGSPRARSVVHRGIDGQGTHLFVSDARSEKNQQLRARQEAEVVYWLPTQRLQFRLRGAATPTAAPAREMWAQLSDATRATFFWPPPGNVRVEGMGEFPQSVPATIEPPPSFEVIVFMPMEVERLDLNPHPHDRRRWQLAHDWQEQHLNP